MFNIQDQISDSSQSSLTDPCERNDGQTPLFLACQQGHADMIHMLLYYGADCTTPSDGGILPIGVLSDRIPEEDQLLLQEILLNHTFQGQTTINLPTLQAAMKLSSELFPKIVKRISDVSYDVEDLLNFTNSIYFFKPKHLKLFLEKIPQISKEIFVNFSPFELSNKGMSFERTNAIEVVQVLLDSNLVIDLLQALDPTKPVISWLLRRFFVVKTPTDQDKFTQIVCQMLAYGLNVTSVDLDTVYDDFGFCELFKILLHMEILITEREIMGLRISRRRRSMAVLFYDPLSEVEDLILDDDLCMTLLDYFNQPKLKNFALHTSCEDLLEKVKKMNQVPLLTELSRNVARRYIVRRFNIKRSVQFQTILQNLPIGEMNRRILAFEKKLY